jgi:hypothetical protein
MPNHFHAREAAAALLKMAKTTSDPGVAAGLVQTAADLKEQVGELALPASAKPPDVQPGNKEAGGTRNSQQS